jgi:uncharacterized protein (UPF0216 family)
MSDAVQPREKGSEELEFLSTIVDVEETSRGLRLCKNLKIHDVVPLVDIEAYVGVHLELKKAKVQHTFTFERVGENEARVYLYCECANINAAVMQGKLSIAHNGSVLSIGKPDEEEIRTKADLFIEHAKNNVEDLHGIQRELSFESEPKIHLRIGTHLYLDQAEAKWRYYHVIMYERERRSVPLDIAFSKDANEVIQREARWRALQLHTLLVTEKMDHWGLLGEPGSLQPELRFDGKGDRKQDVPPTLRTDSGAS